MNISAQPARALSHAPIAAVSLCLWFASSCGALAANVVCIDAVGGDSGTRRQIETAADFFGLTTEFPVLTSSRDIAAVIGSISKPDVVAVIVAAGALPFMDRTPFLAALRNTGRHAPLLIAGVTENTNPELLAEWSTGAIVACRKTDIGEESGSLVVGTVKDVTRQLGGARLPLARREIRYFTLHDERHAESVVAATVSGRSLPVFERVDTAKGNIFFAVASETEDAPQDPTPYREPAVFAGMAAPLLFLRHAAGESAWHTPGEYANLTIDDPWLREPYGNLSYDGLLRQMDRHKFHTTIAFVPWNFGRNEPGVARLFQTRADKLSICLHGNNHDHREFRSYESKPLELQTRDIQQGLARMAKFTEITKVPYDPVMVFPHAISPAQTLAVLKRYNFAATVNFINVPLDRMPPAQPEFAMRVVTAAFSNFPSVRRYSVEGDIPPAQLAIDAFLGNPMLFYAHQGFFASGIDAFNKIADTVNTLRPTTQWQSLGYIAKHLYLQKLRQDGNYDIRAYAAVLHIENRHRRDVTFFIEKEEDFALPLTVTVNGQPYAYRRSGTRLLIELPVHDGMSREVAVTYGNAIDLSSVDVSHNSLRIDAVRYLSDFRDNVVSMTSFGRLFIRSHSQHGTVWNSITLLAGVLGLYLLIRRTSNKIRRRPVRNRHRLESARNHAAANN